VIIIIGNTSRVSSVSFSSCIAFLSALRYFLPSETNMACHKRSGYSDFARVFLDKSDWKESRYTDLVSEMREK